MLLEREVAVAWPTDGRSALIGGEWVELSGRETIASISPSTEEIVGHVPAATAEHVEMAVSAIRPLLDPWREATQAERAAVLRTFAEKVTQHADELIQLEIDDSGLTRRTAK